MVEIETVCAHCGDLCEEDLIVQEEKSFCCSSCVHVYNIIQANNLGLYYSIESTPGTKNKKQDVQNLDFLEDQDVVEKIVDFRDEQITKVHFDCPAIHCSSCIWLLERLHLIHPSIRNAQVNFLDKRIYISFAHQSISLREVVELLSKIGYNPELNFANLEDKKYQKPDRQLLLQIGVAAFAFGNIMLLSFIEYLGYKMAASKFYIGYINLALVIPVLFFSSSDYFNSAWQSLKIKRAGIDVPVVLGIIALFSRSLYEIISQTGGGYLDSLAGFVLFLLIGKWFSNYTMRSINFERNYKSYFPISVLVKLKDGSWSTKSIAEIQPQEIIKIRNGEIIPCDSTIISGKGKIDYSFVNGESKLSILGPEAKIYAGGRQEGGSIELLTSKTVDQSYLTQLWNEKAFQKTRDNRSSQFLNKVSSAFTAVILLIAAASFTYWYFFKPEMAFKVLSSVLIVACPCALALSIPFILGNASRILGRFNFYSKSVQTLEDIFDIDTIVFDKTGTLTDSANLEAQFSHTDLSQKQKVWIKSIAEQSKHPLSGAICRLYSKCESIEVSDFQEIKGYGIQGKIEGATIKLGSSAFILGGNTSSKEQDVIVEIDGKIAGYFTFKHKLRQGVREIISKLESYNLAVLSGDDDTERGRMQSIFPQGTILHFNKNPKEKLEIIKELQSKGCNVMMVGDGLNDAGALKQSNVGLVITEDNNTFSPACDAIISAEIFSDFIKFLDYIKGLKSALYLSFIIALLYNLIGLYFAISGLLSPVIAAILMPTSSITIMIFGVMSSRFLALKSFKGIRRSK